MKEYLNKLKDGSYKLVVLSDVVDGHDGLIEIPEGADIAACTQLSREITFFKDDGDSQLDDGKWHKCGIEVDGVRYHNISEFLGLGSGAQILWKRETLNDQVASAETARQSEKVLKEILEGNLPEFDFEAIDAFIESNVEQGQKHSHYKKDVSHLNMIDIYRVTEMFKPHSCGAHIAKKALCSGQRGHKDLLTDIQDIIDTAERWKEMLIEDEKLSVTIEW